MLLVTSAYAAKPDWAGQGKPDKADIENMSEEARERFRDRMKNRPGKGKKNKPRKDEYEDSDHEEKVECDLTEEECAVLRAERKAEREAARAEKRAEREAARVEREAERAERGAERQDHESRPDGEHRKDRDRTKGNPGKDRRGRPENVGQGTLDDAGKNAQIVGKEDAGQGSSQEVIEKKVAVEQTQVDKSSTTGQAAREEKSKKWWRFWEWGK